MASSSGRDLKCSWKQCGKSFNRKSDLCRHYRIHTNERPYHCDAKDCNKSFIQRSALTVHIRTHTGEKPYNCELKGCHKAFSDSSSLARHRRIHLGRRPYICQECERSFCHKTTLTKHQHRSHPPMSVTRTPLEDINSEQSYHAPVTTSLPSDRFLLAQQAYCHNIATAAYELSSCRNLPMSLVVREQPPSVTCNNLVASSLQVQHAQQQYLQHMQQQQCGQRGMNYPPLQCEPPYALPTVEGHPLTVSYAPTYHYNLQGFQIGQGGLT